MRLHRRSALVVAVLGIALAAPASQAGAVSVTEFPLPVAGSSPLGIAAGADGNIWFVEVTGSRFGRVTPQGVVTDFSTGSGISTNSRPWGIAAGPDGNLWFTEEMGNRVGKIVPTLAQATEFSGGISPGAGPRGIAAGPDGNVWFTEDAGRIGRITPTGAVTEFSLGVTPGSRPLDIHAGPDGNLWFTELAGNRIGRITPSGVVTEFSAGITPNGTLSGITAGPDGNMWFTAFTGNRIGRITPAGAVTEFPLISPSSQPRSIVTGPDGNLWFTQESAGGRLGRITPAGVVTEYPMVLAAGGRPTEITAGPARDLWFTTGSGNRIARVILDPAATTGGASAVTRAGAAVAGVIDPFSAPTSYAVEFGRTVGYGSVTSSRIIAIAPGPVPVTVALAGLEPGTLYHYRLVASSVGGTTLGTDRTFTTDGEAPADPAPEPRATDRIGPRMGIGGRALRVTGGRVRLSLSCPLAETLGCRGAVRLETAARLGPRPAAGARRGPLRIGRAAFRIGGGQTRGVVIRLSPRGRALVRNRARLPVRALITAVDATGNRRVTGRRLVVRPALPASS